jgi:hypothetical protein
VQDIVKAPENHERAPNISAAWLVLRVSVFAQSLMSVSIGFPILSGFLPCQSLGHLPV